MVQRSRELSRSRRVLSGPSPAFRAFRPADAMLQNGGRSVKKLSPLSTRPLFLAATVACALWSSAAAQPCPDPEASASRREFGLSAGFSDDMVLQRAPAKAALYGALSQTATRATSLCLLAGAGAPN